MLDERGIEYRYRDYRDTPLSEAEIREVLRRLDVAPAEVLRTRDSACKALGLTGQEPAEQLVALMALHPTLLQRPIGMRGNRAVIARPPENLLDL